MGNFLRTAVLMLAVLIAFLVMPEEVISMTLQKALDVLIGRFLGPRPPISRADWLHSVEVV